jgi:hypothetical protein
MIEKHLIGGSRKRKLKDQDDQVLDYFRFSAAKGDTAAQVLIANTSATMRMHHAPHCLVAHMFKSHEPTSFAICLHACHVSWSPMRLGISTKNML